MKLRIYLIGPFLRVPTQLMEISECLHFRELSLSFIVSQEKQARNGKRVPWEQCMNCGLSLIAQSLRVEIEILL